MSTNTVPRTDLIVSAKINVRKNKCPKKISAKINSLKISSMLNQVYGCSWSLSEDFSKHTILGKYCRPPSGPNFPTF